MSAPPSIAAEDEAAAHANPQLIQDSASNQESLSNGSVLDQHTGVGSSETSSSEAEGGAAAAGDKGQGEEDEGECPFCLYMKSGPCGESFVNWEKCVEETEKEGQDIVAKCWPVTQALKKCMEVNTEYYGVILQAEQEMEERTALSEQASASKSEEASNQ